jgi:hypothetical protein
MIEEDMLRVLAATALVAVTPAQYRTHVNAVCRGYTPRIHAVEAQMTKAQKAGDNVAYGVALGKLLVYGLVEDATVEAQPVPPALHATMTPILTRMKTVDTHVRAAISAAQRNDGTGLARELRSIGTTSNGLNAKLDAAGLRDCGSNQ